MITFGVQLEGRTYVKREAAYGIVIKDQKIAVASTPRGCFLPGGGVEEGESNQICLARECEEEIGMVVEVDSFIMSTRLFGITPRQKQATEMVGHFYYAHDTGITVEKIEEDHTLVWMTLEDARKKLRLEHQAWVIEGLI